MATVRLRTPFSDAVIEVDGARADKFVELGWVRVPRPRRKKSESDESGDE